MKKKLLTVALAAVMTVSSALSAFAAETLTGTAWWTGMQAGQDYSMKDGKVTLVVETSSDAAAFSVEAYNAGPTDANTDGFYFTTGSDGNGWFGELLNATGSTVSNPFADNNNADPKKFVAGNTYEVTVSVEGTTFKMEYYDATAKELIYTMTGTTTCTETIPELKVHVMAQVGTFTVSEKTATDSAAPSEGETTTVAPSEGETTTAAAGATDTTTAAKDATAANTGDSTMVVALLAVAALSAVVVLKKKTVTE